MQIFELTQPKKRKLNELDFGGPPPKKNFGTNVGPGVQPQYTATPRMKSAPQPGPAPRLPAPTTATGALTTTAPAPKLQTIDAPPQLTGPTAAKQIGMDDPNIVDVVARPKTKTSAQQSALPAPAQRLALPAPTQPAPTAAPAPVPAPAAQPAPTAAAYNQPAYNVPLATAPDTKTTMPTNMSTTGAPVVNVTPATSKSALPPTPPPLKFDPLGSAVKAMTAHNANQGGVGFLNKDNHIPKVRQNAVTGAILVDGEPYNPKNPVHVNAYREWTYGHQGSERIETDKEGGVTIDGKPYNANNPEHVKAYKNHLNPTARPTVPAQRPGAPKSAPAASAPKSAPAASAPDAEPSGVEQALIKLGYSPQQAAISAKKVPPGMSEQDAIKLALSGKLRESLAWSRGFDPSRTLLKKIRQP
jgi:hypothetical protein